MNLFYKIHLHLHFYFYLWELTGQLGLNSISIFKDFILDGDEVLGHFLILTLYMVLSIFIINPRYEVFGIGIMASNFTKIHIK